VTTLSEFLTKIIKLTSITLLRRHYFDNTFAHGNLLQMRIVYLKAPQKDWILIVNAALTLCPSVYQPIRLLSDFPKSASFSRLKNSLPIQSVHHTCKGHKLLTMSVEHSPPDQAASTSPPVKLNLSLLLETFPWADLRDAEHILTFPAALATDVQNPSTSSSHNQPEPKAPTASPSTIHNEGTGLDPPSVQLESHPKPVVPIHPAQAAVNKSSTKEDTQRSEVLPKPATNFIAEEKVDQHGKQSDKATTVSKFPQSKTQQEKMELLKEENKKHRVEIGALQRRINAWDKELQAKDKEMSEFELVLSERNSKVDHQRQQLTGKELALTRLRQEMKEAAGKTAAKTKENSRLTELLKRRDTRIAHLEAELHSAIELNSTMIKRVEAQATEKKSVNEYVATQSERIKALEAQVKTLADKLRYEEVKLRIREEQLIKGATGLEVIDDVPADANGQRKRQASSISSECSEDGEVGERRDGPVWKKQKTPQSAIDAGRERLLMKLLEEYKIAKEAVGLSSLSSA